MARRVGTYLAWIAGGDDSILKSLPTERVRFNALAATLLITASVAAVSVFSALSNILKWPLASSITFALLWGFAIFSIDRFMVLTFDRRHGTRRILLIMLPQIAISLLLSAVIATSLILEVFHAAIVAELAATHAGNGLFAQLQALNELTARNTLLSASRWLLYAVFVSINLLPTMTRLLMSFGPLSIYEVVVRSVEEQTGLPDFSRLLDVMSLNPVDPVLIADSWEHRGGSTQAVFAESQLGPYRVDISLDGPHWLIDGASGSGKSTLMRTLVASLAVANRPDAMTFILVDDKGGSTFKDCALLPHTVGTITNLDAHLANRLLQSLSAELTRREYLLRASGAIDDEEHNTLQSDQAASRIPGSPQPPPRLLVLFDDFADLTDESSNFIAGLTEIARRGRPLGIHLILATADSGKIPAEIRANAGLRIALRVPRTRDSVAFINADSAAYISSDTPGRAFVKTAESRPIPIQVSTLDGGRPEAEKPGPKGSLSVAPGHDGPVLLERLSGDKAGSGEEAADLPALVAAIRQASRRAGIPSQHRPWLPPLAETLLLSDITTEQQFPSAGIPPGGLAPVVYGLSDFPAEQAQRAAVIDFSSFGHMLAAGVANSGKSQLLRTIAGSIAATHSCADVHIYVIDGSNGTLAPLRDLPHCGAAVAPSDTPRLTRLIARLNQESSLRRELLARNGFKDIGEQRAAVPADQRMPHIVVLLNRWEVCTSTLAEADAAALIGAVTELLNGGTSIGMHLVMTGGESLIVGRIAARAKDKLAFRMESRSAYAQIGLRSRDLPVNITAGRAFKAGSGTETQVALLDGEPSAGGQAAALRIVASRALERDVLVELSRRPFQIDILPLVGDRFHVGDAQGRPIGREDILAWLRDRHASGASVALLGPRRAGKTWVLAELKRRLDRDGATHVHHIVVPQPSSSIDTPDALASLLDRRLRNSGSPAEALLDEAQSRSAAGGDRLVFLLDEVGRLVDYAPAAVSWLRDLGQAGAWLVYTGTEKDWHKVVRWALTAPGSSFGNDVNARPVGPIEISAALMFLTGTAANLRVNLAQSTAADIVALTGSWPFYLQVVGDAVVRHVQDLGPVAGQETLRQLVQRRLLDEWAHHFQARWAEIGGPGRAALLGQPGSPPGILSPAQRDDLRDVGLLRPGDVWLDDLPFFDWIARNEASLKDGERQHDPFCP